MWPIYSGTRIVIFSGKKVGEILTKNQKLIVKLIKVNPQISAVKLSHSVGISLRKTEENLKKLRDKQIIKHVGAARGGYWVLLTKGEISRDDDACG